MCCTILDFIDTLLEEKPSEDLEEAAKDFVWEVMENDEDGISDLCRKLRPSSKISDFYDALGEFFIAGAEWGIKSQEKKIADAYEKGKQEGIRVVRSWESSPGQGGY